MSNTIYLMVGIQGSGKSTWANNFLKVNKDTVIVSRDTIRKSLLNEGEDYFSKENKVWEKFIKNIETAINNDVKNIIIDATHISIVSRRKILNTLSSQVNTANYVLEIVVMNTPLQTCLHRNDERTGFELVPKDVIKKFYNQFEMPTLDEFSFFENKYKDIHILDVKG